MATRPLKSAVPPSPWKIIEDRLHSHQAEQLAKLDGLLKTQEAQQKLTDRLSTILGEMTDLKTQLATITEQLKVLDDKVTSFATYPVEDIEEDTKSDIKDTKVEDKTEKKEDIKVEDKTEKKEDKLEKKEDTKVGDKVEKKEEEKKEDKLDKTGKKKDSKMFTSTPENRTSGMKLVGTPVSTILPTSPLSLPATRIDYPGTVFHN